MIETTEMKGGYVKHMKSLLLLCLLLAVPALAGPSGKVPDLMPKKLAVGLFEDTGKTNMKNSRVPYQMRYRYLTYRWSSNWVTPPAGTAVRDLPPSVRNGNFAGQYFKDCDSKGFMPAISYYEIYDLPPSSTGQLQKMRNPTSMLEYFQDFKLLMQQAKTFGKPVLVLVEPDATGFLQGSVNGDPNAAASVRSSGMPELVGLPDTAAGWGLAFLQLRKSVGADNVVLGIHVSGWASGIDLFHVNILNPLQPEVDKVYGLLSKLGIEPNVTGQTYDVLVGDPLDRDADYYRVVRREGRWWDPDISAPVESMSFNRYAEWLRLWNLKSGLRWVLWQLPLGNSMSLNVCNKGQQGQGYQDNRVEYFLGKNGALGRQLFTQSGTIALLFGAGESCQSSFEVDNGFMHASARQFFTAGGLDLPGTGTAVVVDAGAPVVDAGLPIVIDAGPPPSGDVAQFSFEDGAQGFVGNRSSVVASISSDQAFAGLRSLKVSFGGAPAASPNQVILANPQGIPKNSLVTFRVFVPAEVPLSSLQIFVQEDSSTSWKWIANWQGGATVARGKWNTFTLTTSTGNLQAIGVEFQLSNVYTGVAYVDSISWGGQAVTPDAGQTTVDAGRPDSGTPDAGKPDAGRPDAGAPDAGVSPAPDAGPLPTGQRLMPLGDSITAEEWAWRCELSKRLPGVAFVGNVQNMYDVACAPQHEGHPGFTAANINTSMGPWISTAQPSIVVLMAGTNDIAWWTAETGTQVADRINLMLTKIQTQTPGIRIVVCTIPPESSSFIAPNNVDRAVLTQQLNERLRTLVLARAAAGQRVALADVNSVLQVSDLRDGIHPTTQAGITKIAPVIEAAVRKVLVVP